MGGSETLSQKEIDALLNSIKEGGDGAIEEIEKKGRESRDYKVYDFNRPEKFSRENLRSLETIAVTFAKTVSQTLSARLRSSIQVDFMNVEQIPFTSEYADKMSKDYFGFCVVDLGHVSMHEIIMEIDLAFILAAHKRWMGDAMVKEFKARRPISDIEQITLSKMMKNIFFPDLEDVFQSVAEINPKYVKYESDPALLRVTSATDMAAVVMFEMACNEWKTTMKLVIPFQSIEGVIDRLTTEKVRELRKNQKTKNYRQEIAKGLGKVEEDVHISIGETRMSMDELSEIQVGDYIRFDSKIDEPSKIFAAGVHKFNGHIGKSKSRKAVRFVNFQMTEEEIENQWLMVQGEERAHEDSEKNEQ